MLPQPSSIRKIDEFGQKFGGKTCFALYIDIQKTAVYGTKEDIEEEAKKLVDYWSNDYGSGVIAMDYNDPESIGTTEQKIKIALKAFKNAFNEKVSRSHSSRSIKKENT